MSIFVNCSRTDGQTNTVIIVHTCGSCNHLSADSRETACADPERETGDPDPLTKSQRMKRILSNTGPDPLKNHKAIKPTFNVGQSSACQRNAIQMAFRWRTDDGPLIVVFGSSLD